MHSCFCFINWDNISDLRAAHSYHDDHSLSHATPLLISHSHFSIAFVHNTDTYLYRHRKALLRALVDRGNVVFAVAPPGEYVDAIESLGVRFVPWNVNRRGLNPFAELRSLISLRRILSDIRPDILHDMTVKPNIYGALAAWTLGVRPTVASVGGLGYPFTNPAMKARMLRWFLFPLYRWAFKLSDVVTFENEWDRHYLAKPTHTEDRRYVIGGTGIDLSTFRSEAYSTTMQADLRRSLGLAAEHKIVLLVGRMLWDKGIREYISAARLVAERVPSARFLLVGPSDDNPAGIHPDQLSRWNEEGVVQYLGERNDVPHLLSIADLVVLPTYWEGNPLTLMEAACMGKPMVASDIPGCRMVVEHGVNGLLVPPRAEHPLADAIETVLESKELQARFGLAALEKAKREFDENVIAKRFLDLYQRLLAKA